MGTELTATSGAIAALLDPIKSSPTWLVRSIGALGHEFRPTIPEAFALMEGQRAKVEEMCSRLVGHLAPAEAADIGKYVAILQAQFREREMEDVSAAARAEGYLMALDGVPLFALREAVRLAMRGAAGLNPSFMPKAPELRALVDKISLPARAHLVSLRRLLDAKVERSERGGGERELPAEVIALLASPAGDRKRPRHRPNPAGVDHSIPYPMVKGE